LTNQACVSGTSQPNPFSLSSRDQNDLADLDRSSSRGIEVSDVLKLSDFDVTTVIGNGLICGGTPINSRAEVAGAKKKCGSLVSGNKMAAQLLCISWPITVDSISVDLCLSVALATLEGLSICPLP
jgi:hypothetical protein